MPEYNEDLRAIVDELIEKAKIYNPNVDPELIQKAFAFAKKAHEGQSRKSGEPYIYHPLATSQTLVDLEMDLPSIIAALLHDTVEDSEQVSLKDIKNEFGEYIASLVDGVTKLKDADFEVSKTNDEDESATETRTKKKGVALKRTEANLRKMFVATANDFRVMVIKLADRLHNLRTLDSMSEEKQISIARETMQIYAPLAHRLGIWRIKWELEDLAFRHLEPEAYASLVAKMDRTQTEREQYLAEAIDILERYLSKSDIEIHIMGRPKHLWSIYQKMKKQNLNLDEIFDLIALRVIVNKVPDCYKVLGLINDLWMPLPEKFTDFIAMPKPNMYQSLHAKVIGYLGEPIEVQIRTWDMHRTAEFGIAAHWAYKEDKMSGDHFEARLSALRQQIYDWREDSQNVGDFIQSVIDNLFTDLVLVYTPRKAVIELPTGSTPIDFAYRIHSDVGDHCVGVRLNGAMKPLTTQLQSGDIVEIITRPNSKPSLDWLKHVKTSHAKNRIKAYFRKENYADNVERGKESLEKELARRGTALSEVLKMEEFDALLKKHNYKSIDDLFAAVGGAIITATFVGNRVIGSDTQRKIKVVKSSRDSEKSKLVVSLDGSRKMPIHRAKCCYPLPGEEVTGYITKGRGLALHRSVCPNIEALSLQEPDRVHKNLEFESKNGEAYSTRIYVSAVDKQGLTHEVTALLGGMNVILTGVNAQSRPNNAAEIKLTIEVKDMDELNYILLKLNAEPYVLTAERVAARRDNRRIRKG